jgi:hypothetical protein
MVSLYRPRTSSPDPRFRSGETQDESNRAIAGEYAVGAPKMIQ